MSAKKYRNILEYALLLIAVIAFIGLATHLYPLPASQVTALPTPSPSPAPVVQPPPPEALLTLTNSERQQAGVAPLSLDPLLNQSATDKCNDMVSNDYWGHVDKNGNHADVYIEKYEPTLSWWGENLAKGYKTPEAITQAWMNSPAHRDALLNPKYTGVGYGICTEGSLQYTVEHFSALQ